MPQRKMTEADVLGAWILCPGCGTVAQVVHIYGRISHADGSRGLRVLLDDGYESNFWLSGPKAEDGPRDLAQRN